MEKIRLDASAYYRNLATADKQMAINGFNLMDKTGNGKISLRRYSEYFKQRGLVELTYPEFFKALDSNGDDRLDFDEFITVYYLCMNNKLIFCEECMVFLSGSYMSCLQCFNSGSEPYNVCCACYRKNNIDHHKDATFVDNQKLKNSANNNGSAGQSFGSEKITTRDKLTAAILGVSAVNLGINTAKFATTSGPELWENAKHAFDHPLQNPSEAAQIPAFNLSDHRRNAVNSTVFNSSSHGTNAAKTAKYSSDNAEAASSLLDQMSNVLEGASSCSVM
ncbi:hypothetical protein JCGZ_12878 [Jatropha curcas]|uniref:EF-hand domain-containing protein n=1 Tax=Jatropha curcas TaxID=180498 RepID=A0A067KNE7_JATCU|nr:hypothetical protein JCGZ_12878 [Jatropha curcas]